MSHIVRPEVTLRQVDAVLSVLRAKMIRRMERHGPGAFASPHEALGIIAEEYHELIDAIKKNDRTGTMDELYDVACGCLFGVASMVPNENERVRVRREVVEYVDESNEVVNDSGNYL